MKSSPVLQATPDRTRFISRKTICSCDRLHAQFQRTYFILTAVGIMGGKHPCEAGGFSDQEGPRNRCSGSSSRLLVLGGENSLRIHGGHTPIRLSSLIFGATRTLGVIRFAPSFEMPSSVFLSSRRAASNPGEVSVIDVKTASALKTQNRSAPAIRIPKILYSWLTSLRLFFCFYNQS